MKESMGKRIHRINLYAVNVNYYPTVIVNINYYPTLSGALNMVLLKSSAMHLKKHSIAVSTRD